MSGQSLLCSGQLHRHNLPAVINLLACTAVSILHHPPCLTLLEGGVVAWHRHLVVPVLGVVVGGRVS